MLCIGGTFAVLFLALEYWIDQAIYQRMDTSLMQRSAAVSRVLQALDAKTLHMLMPEYEPSGHTEFFTLFDQEAGSVVLSDTVGFIRDLPHSLVAAFHATLEETVSADLLLHVVDSASEDREGQIAAVNGVLEEIGAGGLPQILVWNKIDVTLASPEVQRDACGKISRVLLSARTGEGLDLLREVLAEAALAHKAELAATAAAAQAG